MIQPASASDEMNQRASAKPLESALRPFPATLAVEESLKNQSRKRPRRSMMDGSMMTFNELFDAVSADEKFPTIEWPSDDDDDAAGQTRHGTADDGHDDAKTKRKQSPLSTSSSVSSRQTNKLRRVGNNNCWSTNSLLRPSRTCVLSGLCTLGTSNKRSKTQVDLQDYCFPRDMASFDGSLIAALSTFDQMLGACKHMSFPEIALASE
jgi:hypothetical protein